MIKNFETQTDELSESEMFLIPLMIRGLETKTKDNPIKSHEIVASMNTYLKGKIKFTDARLRKCVNHIRTNGILPVIATSKGYYVSNDRQEIIEQIESLTQRANSIKSCANGLKKFLE